MKRCFLLLIFCLLASFAYGKTFFISFYQSTVREYPKIISQELMGLYDRNEDKREDQLDLYKEMASKQLQKGDAFFMYEVLSDFVMGAQAPATLMANEDFKEDIESLREDALELLIDESQNSDRTISEREFLVNRLSKIAKFGQLHDMDLNLKVVKVLGNALDEDHLVLKHTALVGLKEVALKTGEKWEEVSETAAEKMVDLLGDNSPEVKRIAFIECLNTLEKTDHSSEGIKLIWEKITDEFSGIESPKLKRSVHDKIGFLISLKSGAMFEEQLKEARKELEEAEFKVVVVEDSLEEMLSNLASESSPDELEPIINTLMDESEKNRAVFYKFYSKLISIVLAEEITDYKLRLANDALIKLTHRTQSTLYFDQTASLYFQELFHHSETQRASVPLAMLGSLMVSTDYEQLLLPVLTEISLNLGSDLPLWAQRRLIGLLFIQAGDSPNTKVAMEASKLLVKTAKSSKLAVLRWEANKRLAYLAQYAKENVVKKFAANWK